MLVLSCWPKSSKDIWNICQLFSELNRFHWCFSQFSNLGGICFHVLFQKPSLSCQPNGSSCPVALVCIKNQNDCTSVLKITTWWDGHYELRKRTWPWAWRKQPLERQPLPFEGEQLFSRWALGAGRWAPAGALLFSFSLAAWSPAAKGPLSPFLEPWSAPWDTEWPWGWVQSSRRGSLRSGGSCWWASLQLLTSKASRRFYSVSSPWAQQIKITVTLQPYRAQGTLAICLPRCAPLVPALWKTRQFRCTQASFMVSKWIICVRVIKSVRKLTLNYDFYKMYFSKNTTMACTGERGMLIASASFISIPNSCFINRLPRPVAIISRRYLLVGC